MSRIMTCIACPRGCQMELKREDNEVLVSGNQCSRGVDYAVRESKESLRMLTTTVRTVNPDHPRLAVRLSQEVPLRLLTEYINALNRYVLKHNCIPGDVLLENILGREDEAAVNLIATGAFISEATKLNAYKPESGVTGETFNEK